METEVRRDVISLIFPIPAHTAQRVIAKKGQTVKGVFWLAPGPNMSIEISDGLV